MSPVLHSTKGDAARIRRRILRSYLKQKENLHRTGIAFGEQIVKRIPTEIHDHPMDDVITEQQWYRPKRTTGGE